jgi:hypothetical protein
MIRVRSIVQISEKLFQQLCLDEVALLRLVLAHMYVPTGHCKVIRQALVGRENHVRIAQNNLYNKNANMTMARSS